MNNRINISLLKTLKNPIIDTMKQLISSIDLVLEEKSDIDTFNGREYGQQIEGNIKMIGAYGELKIVDAINNVLKRIEQKQIKTRQELFMALTKVKESSLNFIDYIDDLASKENVSAIRLWSSLNELTKIYSPKNPSIDSLYYPPLLVYKNKDFTPIESKELKKRSVEALEKFKEASTAWYNAKTPEIAGKNLKVLFDVTKSLFDLKHNAAYQTFFLAILARIQVMLLQDDYQFNKNKDEVSWMLETCSLEIANFGDGSKRIKLEILKKILLPLLNKEIEVFVKRSPLLKEALVRFEITTFLKDFEKYTNDETVKQKNLFMENKEEISNIIYDLQDTWTTIIADSSHDDHQPISKKEFNKNIAFLLNKRVFIPSDIALKLIQELAKIRSFYNDDNIDPIYEELGREIATLIIVLDRIIKDKLEVSSDFIKQAELQIKRVEIAYSGRTDDLKNMPVVAWDSNIKQNEYKESVSKVLHEVKKHLFDITDVLNPIVEKHNEGNILEANLSASKMKNIDDSFRQSIGALTIIRQKEAVEIMSVIRAITKEMSKKEHAITDDEINSIMLGLTSLNIFVNTYHNDEQYAMESLSKAYSSLLGKEMEIPEDEEKAIDYEEQYTDIIMEKNDIVLPSLNLEETAQENYPETETETETEEQNLIPEATSIEKEDDALVNEVFFDSDLTPPYITEKDMAILGVVDKSDDPELAELFIEEAEEVLEAIKEAVSRIKRNSGDALNTFKDIKRQFHTLKGSGRQAGFMVFGDVAFKLEERLNRKIDKDEIEWTEKLDHAVNVATVSMEQWIKELKQNNEVYIDARDILKALYEEANDIKVEDKSELTPYEEDSIGEDSNIHVVEQEEEEEEEEDHHLTVSVSDMEGITSIFDNDEIDSALDEDVLNISEEDADGNESKSLLNEIREELITAQEESFGEEITSDFINKTLSIVDKSHDPLIELQAFKTEDLNKALKFRLENSDRINESALYLVQEALSRLDQAMYSIIEEDSEDTIDNVDLIKHLYDIKNIPSYIEDDSSLPEDHVENNAEQDYDFDLPQINLDKSEVITEHSEEPSEDITEEGVIENHSDDIAEEVLPVSDDDVVDEQISEEENIPKTEIIQLDEHVVEEDSISHIDVHHHDENLDEYQDEEWDEIIGALQTMQEQIQIMRKAFIKLSKK